MAAPDPHVRAHGEVALGTLDGLQADGSAETKKQLDEALRQLVVMRDKLIKADREGRPADDWLARTNGIISSLFGTEFPKGGLQWQRVCESREALRALLKNGS